MPAARRDQILPLAVGGAAAAALGTVPLHRLPRPVRVGYVVVPAACTAAILYIAQGKRGSRTEDEETSSAPADATTIEEDAQTAADEIAPRLPWIGRLGLSLGLGTAVAGAGAAGIWIDHRVEDVLRSRRIPAPRLAMGIASGILTVVLAAVDDSEDSEDSENSGGSEG